MTEQTGVRDELREFQLKELAILDAFVAVCERRKLRYYLNAGTLLGAVRHQGFIPWDDDIDVCMPRSDYERFLACAEEELPTHLRPVWFLNQKPDEHPQYHCQIQDLGMPIVQMIAAKPRRTYAWIDVFPLDGMPGAAIPRLIHSLHLLYRRARIQLSMFDENVNQFKQNRPWYENLIIALYRLTGFGKNSDPFIMMKKLDTALQSHPETDSPLWVNLMGAYKLKETVDKAVYGNGKPLAFEGRNFNVPDMPEVILTQLYGDYSIPIPPTALESGHRIYRIIN